MMIFISAIVLYELNYGFLYSISVDRDEWTVVSN
jgi:hypothetical protein